MKKVGIEEIKNRVKELKGKLNEVLLKYSYIAGDKLNDTLVFMKNLQNKYPNVNAFISNALPALAANQPQLGVPLAFVYLYFQVITGNENKEEIENNIKVISKEDLESGFKIFKDTLIKKLKEWEPYIKECGIDYMPNIIRKVNRNAKEKDKEKFLKGLKPAWNIIIDGWDVKRDEENKISRLLQQDKNILLLGNSGSGKSVLMMRSAYDFMKDYDVFFSTGRINSGRAMQFMEEVSPSGKKKVVFIDNIASYKEDVLNLVQNAEKLSKNINFVLAEQKERWGAVKENLNVYNFQDVEISLNEKIKREYINRYLNDKKDEDKILQKSKDAFPVLVMLVSTGKESVKKAIDDVWKNIKDDNAKKTVMKTIFVCDYFNTRIPLQALKDIHKNDSSGIISELNESGLINIEERENKKFISSYHPTISQLILKEKYMANDREISEELKKFTTEIPNKIEYRYFLLELGTNSVIADTKNKTILQASIKLFDKVLEINPKYAAAWNNKGIALASLKRYEEAIECYDKVLEIDPKDAAAWYVKGIALASLKRYEEAIECYDKVLEIDPKYAAAWNNKGIALASLKRYEEAIECYDKVLEIDPKDAAAWNNKACTYSLSGNKNKAIDSLKQAIKLDERHKEMAIKDKDFAALRNDNDFRKIVSEY